MPAGALYFVTLLVVSVDIVNVRKVLLRGDARASGANENGGTLFRMAAANRLKRLDLLVGVAGFEPTTLCPPDKCATRLRYTPTPCEALPNGGFGGKW